MTYGTCKKQILALADELNVNTEEFTDDEDIVVKMPHIFNLAYAELADQFNRSKIKEIQVEATDGDIGYVKYSLPKCKMVKKISAYDENYNSLVADYKNYGENNILISNKESAIYSIEYIPFITLIDENTKNDFELEIDQDLQEILPYKVVCDLFKTDPGENYRAFESEYQRRLQSIVTARKGIVVKVQEGEF